jgi:hypothetical protein
MSNGNVFVFSFSREGFEAIVNLTALDEEYVMAKMAGETLPKSPGNVISMMELRARFNQEREMEVWLVKLSEDFTEEELLAWSDEDPQAVADLARMGENIIGAKSKRSRVVIK